jgi:hypothetical protein
MNSLFSQFCFLVVLTVFFLPQVGWGDLSNCGSTSVEKCKEMANLYVDHLIETSSNYQDQKVELTNNYLKNCYNGHYNSGVNCKPAKYDFEETSPVSRSLSNQADSAAATTSNTPVKEAENSDISALRTAITACEDSTEKGSKDCNISEDETAKTFGDLGKGIMGLNETSKRNARTAEACDQFQALGNLATVSLSGLKGKCTPSFNECRDKCNDAKKELQKALSNSVIAADTEMNKAVIKHKETYEKNSKICGRLSNNIIEAAALLMQIVASNRSANQCKDALTNNKLEMCKLNKEFCSFVSTDDCSNPQVAMSNTVCKCKSNPNLPECKDSNGSLAINNNSFDPNGGGLGGGAGANPTLLPNGGGEPTDPYGYPFDGKPSDGKPGSLSLGKGGGGHGGGGSDSSGGGGGPGPAQKGGAGGSGVPSVLSGWNGGKGGGGWGFLA